MRKMLALAAALSALAPQAALAHPGHDGSSLASGLLHPLTGMDHLAAMLLVGVGAALFVRRSGWMLPATFLAALTIGFVTFAWVPGAVAEAGIIASLVGLGVATALRVETPAPLALIAVAVFGYLHGAAHGIETPHGAAPAVFAAGFLIASAALHLGGYAAARVLPATALRVIGAASAGLGVLLAAG